MHRQSIRIALYSSLAIALLVVAWGWHEIPLRSKMADQVLRESLDQELVVLDGATKAAVEALKFRLLDVLKAEGNDHPTRTFQDSLFVAATLLEWDQVQWKSLWYSVKSKTDLQSTELKTWVSQWPLSQLQAGSVYFYKMGMVDGQAVFALLVPVRRPNQIPMVGVGIFPASQFGLTFSASENRDLRVFTDQGFALSLNQPAYLGTSLKSEPVAGAILDSDEVSVRENWKGEHGARYIGAGSRVPGSNLYVALHAKAAANSPLLAWGYLLLSAMGAGILNWVLFSALLSPLLRELSRSEEMTEQLRRAHAAKAKASVVPDMENAELGDLDFQEPVKEEVVEPPRAPVAVAVAETEAAMPAETYLERVVHAGLRALDGKIKESKIRVAQQGLENCQINVDSLQLQTAIEEILKNACEAMTDSQTRWLTISAKRDQSRIYLNIEDTGCGISEADVTRVFDPFYSTKDSQGVARGLGLNVVRRVVEEFGGKVNLRSSQSNERPGTTVELEWPIERTSTQTSEMEMSEAWLSDAQISEVVASSEAPGSEGRFSLDDVPEDIVGVDLKAFDWQEVVRKPKVRSLD